MHEFDLDAEDREASVTVGGGMLFLVALVLAIHFSGIRFSTGVQAGFTL